MVVASSSVDVIQNALGDVLFQRVGGLGGHSGARALLAYRRIAVLAGLAPIRGHCYVRLMSRADPETAVSSATAERPDEDLILAASRGDRDALASLYDRYSGLLCALAQKMLGNRREAEDLLHDVFMEAWRKSGDYDPKRGTVRAWLVTRLRSRALDRLRSASRAKVVLSTTDEAPPEGVTTADLSTVPDQSRVRKEVVDLDPSLRSVVELAYFGGMSSREVAARLDIPIGTVKSRMARALSMLREAMADGGGK